MHFLRLKAILEDWKLDLLSVNGLEMEWQIPQEAEHGLLTANAAFLLAKKIKQNPNKIALELSESLHSYLLESKLPLTITCVGPYLNLSLKHEFYSDLLSGDFLINDPKNILTKLNETVLLDYVGANVAKRLHAGHMRNLNLGEALRRMLSCKYEKIITDNHWGDWGVQFGVLLWGFKQIFEENKHNLILPALNRQSYQADPVGTLQAIYVWSSAQEEVVPDWKNLVREEFLRLEQGDLENRRLWQEFVAVSKFDLQKDLSLFGIPAFDLEQGESFYEPDMQLLSQFMDAHNLWIKEGLARYFDFEILAQNWKGLSSEEVVNISKLGRAYLISSNGYTSYCYRDVAARWQWARDYQADLMLSVVDKTQKHNFDQAFAIICYLASLDEFKAWNQTIKSTAIHPANPKTVAIPKAEATLERLSLNHMQHLGYGFLSLPEGKMSTRKGNVLLLRDLLEQVKSAAISNLTEKNPDLVETETSYRAEKITLAALKWFDLNRDSWSDLVLDTQQILQFEGNTGVYQLYTFARLKSILRKSDQMTLSQSNLEKAESVSDELNLLSEPEKIIIQTLYSFPLVLERSIQQFKPHILCNYLFELCNKVNSWYSGTTILKEENPNRKALLLKLILAVSENLKSGLDLLAIDVLEEI